MLLPARADGRVVKKLRPSEPGARQRAKISGDQLLGVRYRMDSKRQRRQTTVELVVDEGPTMASLLVRVAVAWAETELREKLKCHGAKWDASSRLWTIRLDVARALGLADRIVNLPQQGAMGRDVDR